MSTNTLLTPTVIANELLRRFKNSLTFAKSVSNESFSSQFQKIGDTYNMRVPVQFSAVKAQAISTQDITEVKRPITIDTQAHVAFSFSSKDLTLTVDRFSDRYLKSASLALSNQFEVDGLTMAKNYTAKYVGSAGTDPSALLTFLQAGQKIDESAAPMGDRKIIVNPAAQVATVDALKGLFQSSTQIKQQYETGHMGTTAGFDWAMSQNVPRHTVGSWGTPQVDGASQTGSTLNVKGLTATTGTVKKGDKFTIANVLEVNPVSGVAYTNNRQFTVTADATADGSGLAALSIFPAISATGAGKTVNALAADSASITKLGTASTAYAENLAYTPEAFAFAMVPLEKPMGVHFASTATDPDTGLSLRIVSQYNISEDVFYTRVDALYGWAPRRNEFACVIIGA